MSPRRRNRQTLLASLMLVAFAARALIPAGFMPSSERPLSLEICWEDFPAARLAHDDGARAGAADMDPAEMGSMDMASMPAHPMAGHHHHHPGAPAHGEHCVFGSACSTGPVPHPPVAGACAFAQPLNATELVAMAETVRLVHLPQPRAPPAQLS